MNDKTAEIILRLQQGLPLERRPFAALAQTCQVSEDHVLQAARDCLENGSGRRFGAIFDARRLGYVSTLCAAFIPGNALERAADRLSPFVGVTHCYQRDAELNLWFTLTALQGRLDDAFERCCALLRPHQTFHMSAVKRYKIGAIFDPRDEQHRDYGDAANDAAQKMVQKTTVIEREQNVKVHYSEQERGVVRLMQGNLAIEADFFQAPADACHITADALLDILRGWRACGALRRIGMIMRHRTMGFRANGMCVWQVDAERIDQAGLALAASPEVTHCYERLPVEPFPYNLYAMVHAHDVEEARGCWQTISRKAGLEPDRMLFSVHEFKKTSPVFFQEHTS